MTAIVLNVLFGLVPSLAFAWSLAADDRKAESERVVASAQDARRHWVVFALIYGLWSATLAMGNWMLGASWPWIALWLTCSVFAFIASVRLGR